MNLLEAFADVVKSIFNLRLEIDVLRKPQTEDRDDKRVERRLAEAKLDKERVERLVARLREAGVEVDDGA